MLKKVLLPLLLVALLAFSSVAFAAGAPVVHVHTDEGQVAAMEAPLPAQGCPMCYNGVMLFAGYHYEKDLNGQLYLAGKIMHCSSCSYSYIIEE